MTNLVKGIFQEFCYLPAGAAVHRDERGFLHETEKTELKRGRQDRSSNHGCTQMNTDVLQEERGDGAKKMEAAKKRY